LLTWVASMEWIANKVRSCLNKVKYGLEAKQAKDVYEESKEKDYRNVPIKSKKGKLSKKDEQKFCPLSLEIHKKRRDGNEYKVKEIDYLVDIEVACKLFEKFVPVMSDYFHWLCEHASAFLYEYNDLYKFANQSVENSHSTSKRILDKLTCSGSRGRQQKSLFPIVNTPSYRRAESVLEIFYGEFILKMYTLLGFLKKKRVGTKIKAFTSKIFTGHKTFKEFQMEEVFKERVITFHQNLEAFLSIKTLETYFQTCMAKIKEKVQN